MSYTKTNWQNTPSTQTPISAANLNHMEQGIYDATSTAESAQSGVDGLDPRMDLVEQRLDNLIPQGTPTQGNAELIDIRVGANGVTYPTAGDAVRGQVNQIKSALSDNTNTEILNLPYKDKYISLSSSPVNLTPQNANTYSCGYWVCNAGDKFTIYGSTVGISAKIYAFIDSEGNILSSADSSSIPNKKILIAPEYSAYLVCNTKNDDLTLYKGETIVDTLNDQIAKVNEIESTSIGTYEITDFLENKAVILNTDPVNLTPVDNNSFRCYILDCAENDVFTVSGYGAGSAWLYAFLDADNHVLSYMKSALVEQTNIAISAPQNAVKLVINNLKVSQEYVYPKCYVGLVDLSKYIYSSEKKLENDINSLRSYNAKFETMALPTKIDELFDGNLYLIAVKSDNTYYANEPNGRLPVPMGYLYLNQNTQKLYYSERVYNNPKYLCDWDTTLTSGLECQYYHCTITKDGDIIFFKRPYNLFVRSNPIIYPHGNYDNPYIIDFGDDIKPFGFAVDSGVDHCYNGDYFIFAEYRGWRIEDNDTPIYVWKVVKPYNTKECWTRVCTKYVRYYTSPEGSHPGEEVGHFHTATFDVYSGAWLVTSGDHDYQCRFLVSKDDGTTWVDQQLGGGQSRRTVGVVFTSDAMYYQTDSTLGNHALYKADRGNDGYIDFSTLRKVCDLSSTGAAGYGTALMQYPYGLLFIDRMEDGAEGVTDLPLYFYDLKEEKLIKLLDTKAIEDYTSYDSEGRFGLPPLAYTHYQSPYEDGIIMGATTVTKPFLLDLVGNKKDIIVGVLKYSIVLTQAKVN